MTFFAFRECVALFISISVFGTIFLQGKLSIKLIFYISDIIPFLYLFNVQFFQ